MKTLPTRVGNDLASIKRVVEETARQVNLSNQETVSGAIHYVRDCYSVPQNTDIDGAREIAFDSTVAGECVIILRGVDFEGGVRVGLNGADLGALTGADAATLYYEVSSTNLQIGVNVLQIWSPTNDNGELRSFEVYRDSASARLAIAASSAEWGSITGTGKPEDNATRNVNRGEWASGVTYELGDIVYDTTTTSSYQYINTTPTNGNAVTNGTYWALLASGGGGSPGAPGQSAQIEYSASETGPWDSTFDAGDAYLRSRVGTDAWQGPFRVQGIDGISTAELTIKIRAASAPSTPVGGSYNFTTKTLILPTGWSAATPSGALPVYESRVLASITGASGTDSSLTWSTPSKAFENGQATDFVFLRATSQPSTPAASSGTPSGWFTDVDSVPAGAGLIYSAFGRRASTSTNYTWQTPVLVEGQPGAKGDQGDPGLSSIEYTFFRRATSAPSTPSGGTYNFSTKAVTPPSGWSAGIPSGSDPVYASRAIASVQGVTGTGTFSAHSAPIVFVSDGSSGTDGQSSDFIFRSAASQPATPSNTTGLPSGWYDNLSDVPASSDPIWISFRVRATPTSVYVHQEPKKFEGQDGAPVYFFTAWANSADGATDFSLTAGERTYTGYYSSTNATQSTTPANYEWQLTKGEPGSIDYLDLNFTRDDETDFLRYFTRYSGSGDPTKTANTSTIRFGDNSGDDESRWISNFLVPVDEGLFYISAATGREAGSGFYHVGVVGTAADGVTLVDRTGADFYNASWITARARGNDSYTELRGYFKGRASSGIDSLEAPDPKSPKPLHTNARYARIVLIFNFSGQPGQFGLSTLRIGRIQAEQETALIRTLDTINADNSLNTPGVLKGSNIRQLVNGEVSGFALDGASITFPTAYPANTVPHVQFGAGGVDDDGSDTVYRATSLSNTGFVASLKKQGLATSTTLREDTGAVANQGIADFAIHKSQSADAVDGLYRFEAEVTLAGQLVGFGGDTSVFGSATVGLAINTGAGFEVVKSLQYTTQNTTETFTIDVDVSCGTLGQHGGYEFGILVVEEPFGNMTIDSFDKVSYTTSGTTPSTTSATPSGSNPVPFTVSAGLEQ